MSNVLVQFVRLSAILAAVGTGLAATAQTSGLMPPASDKDKDKDKIKDPNKPEVWQESKEVLDKELEVTRALKSIKGTVTANWEYALEGQPPINSEFLIEYAVERPDKYWYENKYYKIFVDGKTVTVVQRAGGNTPYSQYVQRPMPDLWRLRETIADMTGQQVLGIMGEPILRSGMSLEQTLRNVKTVERIRAVEMDGKPGVIANGTAVDEKQPGTLPYTFERWFAESDHLTGMLKEDWTAMYQDIEDRAAAENSEGQATPVKPRRFAHVGWTKKYSRQLNPTLAPELFIFAPGPKDRKVDKFVTLYMNQDKHIPLLGHPAPAIKGRDFDGHDVDIASYKGKVVVLDFWAIWCSHCVEGLPAMQKIKEAYADKPVMMIGVDCDSPGDGEKVKRFLAKRGINIQQFDDTTKALCNSLSVNSWPFVMIIDQQGNVADTDVGYVQGKEKDLIEKIDKLLAGKPIRTPEEMSLLKELVGTGSN
jgi:thiol-disulfide isomerase/thioredoxin